MRREYVRGGGHQSPTRLLLLLLLALVVACATDDATQTERLTPKDNEPHLMLIVYGYQFAKHRVPIFVRSALSSRSTALHLHVVGDEDGLQGFKEVWQSHAIALDLVRTDDCLLYTSPSPRDS